MEISSGRHLPTTEERVAVHFWCGDLGFYPLLADASEPEEIFKVQGKELTTEQSTAGL